MPPNDSDCRQVTRKVIQKMNAVIELTIAKLREVINN
jgi:hypothetical protein